MIMIHFIKMDWTSVSREYFSLCMILCVLWITSEHCWAKPKAHFLKSRLMCKVLWKSNVSSVNIWYKNVSMQLSILCFIWPAAFLDLGVCGLYSLFLQHGGWPKCTAAPCRGPRKYPEVTEGWGHPLHIIRH